MSVDVSTLALEVKSDGVATASDRLKTLSAEGGNAENAANKLSSSFNDLSRYAKLAAEAFALWKLADLIKDATLLAARYETLGVVMQVVGNNAGYSNAQMVEFQKGLQKTGISAIEARQGLALMGQAQVDMAQSAKLARVAQDAAVIGNINSSEAFNRMLTGISTGQSIILHHLGLMTNFMKSEQDLAASLGKTKDELTSQELTQARVNEVMRVSIGISGSYEAAMGTTGKALNSMKRFIDDAKVAFGGLFTPALGFSVDELTKSLKDLGGWFKTNSSSVKDWGAVFKDVLITIGAEVTRVSMLLDKMGGSLTSAGMLLFGPGAALGNENSKKQFERMAAANMEYEQRYKEGEARMLSLAGKMSDTATSGTGDNSAEQARIAAGNKRRAEESADAKRAAAEKAAEEAKALAEKQAQYDKQLLDAEAALKQQYADNAKHREESALKDRMAQLQYEKDMGLKTTQEYLDAKYAAEIDAQQKEVQLAQDQAHERYLAYDKVSRDPGADRLMQAKAEDDWAKAVGKASEAQARLNATIAQQPRDNDRHTHDMRHFADEMAIQKLQIEGNSIAANAAANELKYSDMLTHDYTTKEVNLQRVNDTLKIANDLYARQVAVRNELAALDMANDAKAAELVGVDPKTGTINTIADQTAHALAIQQAAHNKRMEMIEEERQSAMDAYRLSSKSAEDYAKVIGTLGAKEEERALSEQENANKTAEIHTKATNSQLAEVGNYTSLAAQLFTGLADMQDQSSRRGFETAKAMNIASAVMSTASAIIAQLSGPDAWTPIAWARSATAAALGAMQIAKISSTTFGGGASAPSASAGSFGGGSAGSSSGVGSSIGQQVHSVQETQTEASLRKLAESSNNASMAITKVADGLTKVSDLFTTDYSKNFIKGISSDPSPDALFKSGGWKGFLSGNAGLGLAVNNGNLGGKNFTFNPNFSDLDPGVLGGMTKYLDQIKGSISRAAVTLGTSTDFSKSFVAPAVIQTAGRTEADIQKDIDKFFTDASNSLAKTTTGLKEFTFSGEDAFTALMRLSTSLQGVNSIFELTGRTLIESTLKGADAAYRLADAFGGLDNMTKAVKTYYEGMYSDTERAAMEAAQATREVDVAFKEMGMAAPATRDEFRNLVNSIDVTTASGADLYKSLMDIAPAFITMTDAVDKANKALRDAALSAAQSAASALVEIMGGTLSTGSIESIYKQKQQSFSDAVSAGRTTELPDLAKALLESSRQYNASGAGYTTDYDKVTKVLADVAGMHGSPTLTAAEKQVQLLTDIKDAIQTGTMTTLAGFAGQLASGSSVSNAVNSTLGGDNAAMQQKAILASQTAMQMAIGRARPDLKYDIAPIGHPDGKVDGGDALVWQELATGALKWSDVGLPAFANGGITSGPSIAGEGYYREAVIPLPDGRSVPVSFTGAADNYQGNAELIAEIRALRQEVSELKGHAAANVRVAQAGFSELIDQGDQSNRTNSQIAQKIRLGAAA